MSAQVAQMHTLRWVSARPSSLPKVFVISPHCSWVSTIQVDTHELTKNFQNVYSELKKDHEKVKITLSSVIFTCCRCGWQLYFFLCLYFTAQLMVLSQCRCGDDPGVLDIFYIPFLSDSTVFYIAGLSLHWIVTHGISFAVAAFGSIPMQTMINNSLNHLCQKNQLHPSWRAKAAPHGQECRDQNNILMWSKS